MFLEIFENRIDFDICIVLYVLYLVAPYYIGCKDSKHDSLTWDLN